MKAKIRWILMGAVLLIGVGITIADYREWKHLEMDKFGQGWNDLDKPAMKLTELYNDRENGIRLHLPGEWKVGKEVVINVGQVTGNLPDLTDARVKELEDQGIMLTGHREYISGEKSNLTVITYEKNLAGGKARMVQEAWAKRADMLVILKAEVDEDKWVNVKKTYWEIFSSLEL